MFTAIGFTSINNKNKRRKEVFQNITVIKSITKIEKDDCIFLVQIEDTIDIWASKDRIRGSNEIIRYYSGWEDMELNEQDFIVLAPKNFYF